MIFAPSMYTEEQQHGHLVGETFCSMGFITRYELIRASVLTSDVYTSDNEQYMWVLWVKHDIHIHEFSVGGKLTQRLGRGVNNIQYFPYL